MVRPPHERPVRSDLIEEREQIRRAGGAAFVWSLAKIRIACLVIFGAATPAAAGFAVSDPFVKWLSVAWLGGVTLLMHCLSRRASAGMAVLSVDRRGIFDRRLMSRRIEWQEIEAICPVNVDRNHTVDIYLRWPMATLRETRWPMRIGAYCQMGYGVPAVTISMLLVDGNVSEMLKQLRGIDLICSTTRTGERNSLPTDSSKPRQRFHCATTLACSSSVRVLILSGPSPAFGAAAGKWMNCSVCPELRGLLQRSMAST